VQNTYFLQLKEREDFARRCFSAVVVFTLPVVGLLSIWKTQVCQLSKSLDWTLHTWWSINCTG